jgi:sec-independent protein translocase protein TatA
MNPVLLFLNLGGGEVAMILIVVLLLFGGKGIPTLARTLGKGVREFKDAASGIQRDLQNTVTQVDDEVHEKIQEVKRDIDKDEFNAIKRDFEKDEDHHSVKRDDEIK